MFEIRLESTLSRGHGTSLGDNCKPVQGVDREAIRAGWLLPQACAIGCKSAMAVCDGPYGAARAVAGSRGRQRVASSRWGSQLSRR